MSVKIEDLRIWDELWWWGNGVVVRGNVIHIKVCEQTAEAEEASLAAGRSRWWSQEVKLRIHGGASLWADLHPSELFRTRDECIEFCLKGMLSDAVVTKEDVKRVAPESWIKRIFKI